MNTIYVALSCDDNYARYAAAVIVSALESLDSAWRMECAVLHGGLSAESIACLERLGNERLRVRLVDSSSCRLLRELPEMAHWTTAMYYRFLVVEAFSPNVDRVIYLDCDVLVLRSLHHLYGEDFEGAAIAAVENPGTHRLRALQIKKNKKYFNSGVLLINLAAWRTMPILQSAMMVAERFKGKLVNPDQDMLNVMFDGDVKLLDPRWNVQVSMFRGWRYATAYLMNPWVVHFTTQLKPWSLADPHPYANEYRLFARLVGVTPTPLRIGDRVKYPVRLIRRYLVFYLRVLLDVIGSFCWISVLKDFAPAGWF
jgi:Lipopolysaccharide biosynthesis proteins, LPS:glycosyltransferases